MICGGGYGFSFMIFFSTPSLNVQFFQTVSKANNFFLSGKTQNNFFTIYFIWFSAHHVKFSGVTTFTCTFTICFDKESNCVEYVEQNWWNCVNNFNFWSKVRALDRFQYKLEGERRELKIFISIFLMTIFDQTFFFYQFMNKLFFSQK